MSDHESEPQPTLADIAVFEALSALIYEFRAEPTLRNGIPNALLDQAIEALKAFSDCYPENKSSDLKREDLTRVA